MKKTYNINLGGCGFVIDEDAYETLASYLNTLRDVCTKSGQPETVDDIEMRIAEIFTETCATAPNRILTMGDVEWVIDRMGRPEEIMPQAVEEGVATPPPYSGKKIEKRLYRDTDNKILGGVCSGLAWYMGVDPVWVRIVAVLLAFLTGSTLIWVYIVLWIIIPAARTPYERMQMMGMDSSMDTIGRVVRGEPVAARYNAPRPDSRGDSSGVGKVMVMVVSIIALLLVGSLLLAMSFGFLGCIIALFVSALAPPMNGNWAETRIILALVASAMVVLGIPLLILFRWLIGLLTEKDFAPLSWPQRITLLAIWLAGVIGCFGFGLLASW